MLISLNLDARAHSSADKEILAKLQLLKIIIKPSNNKKILRERVKTK